MHAACKINLRLCCPLQINISKEHKEMAQLYNSNKKKH